MCTAWPWSDTFTDIDDFKLTDSRVINSSFHHNKTGCQMTFDDDYSAYWVYFVNFLGTLAVLPGNIVSALLMDKIGRLSMLGMTQSGLLMFIQEGMCERLCPAGGSMVLSGISCFFLWFGTSESMMIFMLCLYNGLSISAWNSLDVVTTELYPTDRRSVGTRETSVFEYIPPSDKRASLGDGGVFPCCHFQGHRLWLLQRLVQAGSSAGQPDLWLAGWHHQSYSHPAGVVRAGLWRPGGAPTARHEGQRPHVNLEGKQIIYQVF